MCCDRDQQSETKVYHFLYEKICLELVEELSVLEKVTNLIQIFKDNNIVALRKIYENGRKIKQIDEQLYKVG
ncbi:MAG: hypothetical protein KAX49_04830 [Halanaerobiales bacterium]|nr:hypothetical protein [Halanaerobiales bacterium]